MYSENEKLSLLAQNVSRNIDLIFNERIMALLSFKSFLSTDRKRGHVQSLIQFSTLNNHLFNHLLLVSDDKATLVDRGVPQSTLPEKYSNFKSINFDGLTILPVSRDDETGKNMIGVVYPFHLANGKKMVIYGDFETDIISATARDNVFGKKGHIVITDQEGNILFHPNPLWVNERKNIADWSIIKNALAGEKGKSRIFSPYYKVDMYVAFVPGVLVQSVVLAMQPESEVFPSYHSLLMVYFGLFFASLAMSIILIFWIHKSVVGPITWLREQAKSSSTIEYDGLNENLKPWTPEIFKNIDFPVEYSFLFESVGLMLTSINKNRALLSAVLNHTRSGLILTDTNGIVQFSSGLATHVLVRSGSGASGLEGLSVQDIYPEFAEYTFPLDASSIPTFIHVVNDSYTHDLSLSFFKSRDGILLVIAISDTTDMHSQESLSLRNEIFSEFNKRFMHLHDTEQRKLALDLHDEVGSQLTGLKKSVEYLEKLLHSDSSSKDKILDEVKLIRDEIDNSYDILRSLITSLRTSIFSDNSFTNKLDALIAAWRKRNPTVKLEIDIDYIENIDDLRAYAIYRILQECLTNISKHAKATYLVISLNKYYDNFDKGSLELRVKDDGVGVDRDSIGKDKHGIRGMIDRVESFGGSFTINSSEGKGTDIHIILPIVNTK